jgi:hypothetical protein
MSTYSPGVSSVDVSEANGQKVEKHPNLQRGGRQAPAHPGISAGLTHYRNLHFRAVGLSSTLRLSYTWSPLPGSAKKIQSIGNSLQLTDSSPGFGYSVSFSDFWHTLEDTGHSRRVPTGSDGVTVTDLPPGPYKVATRSWRLQPARTNVIPSSEIPLLGIHLGEDI